MVITASRFKAECLALLDDVAATGAEVVITKRGRPVAKLVPVEAPGDLTGTVTFLVDDDALVAPLDIEWDALA